MTSRKTVVNNIFWRILEQCGSEGVSFVVSIILARILLPENYGVVAIVTSITAILNLFINCGMGTAIIQKKDADDLDFSTLFYFNMAMCLFLYVGLFFAAPLIAQFYGYPELKWLIRVSGISLIISAVKGIQQSYVARNFLFKRFFFATLGGTIGAAALGIVLALKGFGAWALVIQGLFNHFVDTIILWLTVKWRPKRMFSWKRLKQLFSFGSKMLIGQFLDKVYGTFRTMLIGKVFSHADLAYYQKGEHYSNLLAGNLDLAMDSVLFSAMSKEQDDKENLRLILQRTVKMSAFIVFPLMIGLAACATPLVRLGLGEKWMPSVFYLQILSFSVMWNPISNANINAIKSLGKVNEYLKINTAKKIIALAITVITMFISLRVMTIAIPILAVGFHYLDSIVNNKTIQYGFWKQVKDIFPVLLLSGLMFLIVWGITHIGLSDILTLIIQIPLGVGIYVGGSILFKIDSFEYVKKIIKDYLPKKKSHKGENN